MVVNNLRKVLEETPTESLKIIVEMLERALNEAKAAEEIDWTKKLRREAHGKGWSRHNHASSRNESYDIRSAQMIIALIIDHKIDMLVKCKYLTFYNTFNHKKECSTYKNRIEK